MTTRTGKRLFGTDGIRAVAGDAPLDPPTVRRFGAALARVLAERNPGTPRVLLGRDTRESGPWLRDAVAAGLRAEGGEAVDAGVITTPGLACLLRRHDDFHAGVMISASHNPFEDNGLKVFGSDGVKLNDAAEAEMEELILDGGVGDCGDGAIDVPFDAELERQYVAELEALCRPDRFRGMRILLDGSNGAASRIAPAVFAHYGAEVDAIGVAPDGRNINLGCGSLHLDGLAARVVDGRYDVGIAFDGDADRCLAIDAQGREVDGDRILYICGLGLKRAGALRGDAVVATIMSNFWLEHRFRDEGIALHRAQVGDKYVLERMVAEDLVLGGEQSGHVIFRDHATTGDGILTGLKLLDTLLDDDRSLVEIQDSIVPFPQVLLNVRVASKPDLRAHATIGPLVAEIEKDLEGTGRVVLRYSGTEPVARVMVEGQDGAGVRDRAQRLAAAIEAELGG